MEQPVHGDEPYDVVVVGSGVAGLSAALELQGRRVALLTAGTVGEDGASSIAQGGIAAAVGAGDSPREHADDTQAVASGLSHSQTVRWVTSQAPAWIERLVELGADLDRDGAGNLALGREAAHSRQRIVHAHGDATGRELTRAMARAVRDRCRLDVVSGAQARRLLVDEGVVHGLVWERNGQLRSLRARAVVLCTGGLGQLYAHTTNPSVATGSGIAMAARAGALLADLEFVQFHPTALALGADPMPLLTEALRGAGARVIDEQGRRVLLRLPGAELAPRDQVARAIDQHRGNGHRVFLDLRPLGSELASHFPTAMATCRAVGIDPCEEPVPISPAAHYHMGGVWTDRRGRTSLPGLWAGGEVACTGLHGANRLASNSLLEGLVLGEQIGKDVDWFLETIALDSSGSSPASAPLVEPESTAGVATGLGAELRERMWRQVGLQRTARSLEEMVSWARSQEARLATHRGVPPELADRFLVARLIAEAALARRESRGSHRRIDYPQSKSEWARRHVVAVDRRGRVRHTWAAVQAEPKTEGAEEREVRNVHAVAGTRS